METSQGRNSSNKNMLTETRDIRAPAVDPDEPIDIHAVAKKQNGYRLRIAYGRIFFWTKFVREHVRNWEIFKDKSPSVTISNNLASVKERGYLSDSASSFFILILKFKVSHFSNLVPGSKIHSKSVVFLHPRSCS